MCRWVACGVCVVECLLVVQVQVGCVWCVRGRALAGRVCVRVLCVWCVRGRALAGRACAGGLRVWCALGVYSAVQVQV